MASRLRIERLVQLAAAGRRSTGVVAGISGELSEYESVEARVVGGCLEAERAGRAPQADFDRLRGLDLEIGIALVEGRGRVMCAAGEQLGRLRRALDILRGDAADEIPRKFLDQARR